MDMPEINNIQMIRMNFSFKNSLLGGALLLLLVLQSIVEKAEFKDKYFQDILGFYYRYKIIEKIEELEGHIAESKNFILLSAFVPESFQ